MILNTLIREVAEIHHGNLVDACISELMSAAPIYKFFEVYSAEFPQGEVSEMVRAYEVQKEKEYRAILLKYFPLGPEITV